jgi:S1-C subfamily serine protease
MDSLRLRFFVFGISAATCWSCGGSKLEARSSQGLAIEDAPLLSPNDSSLAAPVESVSVPVTQLERTDVVAAVDAGLGRFLQKLEMEASLTAAGEFAGFRIVRLHDKEVFQGLGIGPGDVVTSINQRPIERPTEAYEAFVSLRTAESLDIDYLRGGRLMHLSLPIVGEAKAKQAKTDVSAAKKVAPAASHPPAKKVPSKKAQ